MKTIIFHYSNPDALYTSVGHLCKVIKERKEAKHRLFIRPLMQYIYTISMGCETTDGERNFIGEHEVIFVGSHMTDVIERLKRTKDIVCDINGMCIVGTSEEKQEKTNKLIDWLLEKEEEIKL